MKVVKKAKRKSQPKQRLAERQPKRGRGQPTIYTLALAETICELIVSGNSLAKICGRRGMPAKATVMRLLHDNDAFRDQYARAREDQADFLADEIIEIADSARNMDSAGVQAARLRVDSRKWVASKLKPKRYGERLEIDGDITHRTPDSIRSELDSLLRELGVGKDDAKGSPDK